MVGGYERTELMIMPGGHSGVIAPLSMMKDLPMKIIPANQVREISVIRHLVRNAEFSRVLQQSPFEHLDDIFAPSVVQPSSDVSFNVVIPEEELVDSHVFRCKSQGLLVRTH